MANANSTETEQRVPSRFGKDGAREYYLNASPEYRHALAQEMAREIFEHKERIGVLVSAIVEQLTPNHGEDPVDYQALKLAEIAEEMLNDVSQDYDLLKLLEVIGGVTQ